MIREHRPGQPGPQGPVPQSAEGDQEIASPSVIAPDLCITGEVFCEGDIEIYGWIQGRVNSKSLTVGEGALVDGSIRAQEVRIGGSIKGPITAHSVTMDKTACVEGSIFHHDLSAHPESIHRGRKPWRLRPLEEHSEP